jgi:ribosomal protein S18 acetylase RimI-like enzyme
MIGIPVSLFPLLRTMAELRLYSRVRKVRSDHASRGMANAHEADLDDMWHRHAIINVGCFTEADRPTSEGRYINDRDLDLETILRACGLLPSETQRAMVANLDRLRLWTLWPSRLRIRRVQTADQLQDYVQVVAGEPRDPRIARFYELATPALLRDSPPLWLYVGYMRGQPVITAESWIGGAVVNLWNLATLDAASHPRYASRLARQVLRDAHAAGCRVAILHTAASKEGMYANLGFEPLGYFALDVPPEPTADVGAGA